MKSLLLLVAVLCALPLSAQDLFPLWDSNQKLPELKDIPIVENLEFSVIKPFEFEKDGYRFLHGVALIWHKDKLYASFGHNKNGENTVTEEANYRVSEDEGNTWGPVKKIGGGGKVAVSHGEFLSYKDKLWAFMGEYDGIMENLRVRAYLLNEDTDNWEDKGIVARNNFWPLAAPEKMEDGNWIMSGFQVNETGSGNNPPAVAISQGDNFTKWDVVVIPMKTKSVWGESTIMIDGPNIINVARWGKESIALASKSEDYGSTWSELRSSNLPMTTSKPYSGQLSTGEYYLIGASYKGVNKSRNVLTIALSRPGELVFSKMFVIRHAVFPEGPGESHPKAALAYPHAVEYQGKLYVGYSNSGGKVGRPISEGRSSWNNNSAEMAIIPLEMITSQ
ncbi:sialidase family protein [uncultured Cyclobacterium sp.]|mgnify:CR=1 FL=1|uniref:sialidase family protein n=1 Tax=uncultured Cyclobacterium sp. TaxID=453820 RepID=UPI0030EE652B|tara:strand:+ start:21912 stop:23087 length:1176 start_codon:yes stop_codon:yes gene_type:complete